MTKVRRSIETAAIVAGGLLALAALRCTTKSSGAGPGEGGAKSQPGAPPASLGVPPFHRASANACTIARGQRSIPDGGGSNQSLYGGCTKDSECTSGKNGRCDNVYNSMACACDYDTCNDDSACAGAVCACRTSEGPLEPNRCLHVGNCTTDADCGPGSYCSPSPLAGDLCDGNNIAYYCHTPDDACVQDSQCVPQGVLNPPTGPCLFSPDRGRWVCYDGTPFGCDGGVAPACGGN